MDLNIKDSSLDEDEKLEILEKLAQKLQDLDDLHPDYARMINENFWDLL